MVSLAFVKLFEIVFGDFIVKFFFCFYEFYRKEFDGLKFICGYLIILCSVILMLIIYKIGHASKFLVRVWGVTIPFRVIRALRICGGENSDTYKGIVIDTMPMPMPNKNRPNISTK